MTIQKITPFLWFDNQAEEAVKFYTSIFKNSKIIDIARYGEEGPKVSGKPKGSVMTIRFQLDGQEFIALNGGPHFKFTEALSLVVNCNTQEEVDEFWEQVRLRAEKRNPGNIRHELTQIVAVATRIAEEILARDAHCLDGRSRVHGSIPPSTPSTRLHDPTL